MCSITLETADVGSSYNHMRGPGIQVIVWICFLTAGSSNRTKLSHFLPFRCRICGCPREIDPVGQVYQYYEKWCAYRHQAISIQDIDYVRQAGLSVDFVKKASDMELCLYSFYHQQAVKQTVDLPDIWDSMALMLRHSNTHNGYSLSLTFGGLTIYHPAYEDTFFRITGPPVISGFSHKQTTMQSFGNFSFALVRKCFWRNSGVAEDLRRHDLRRHDVTVMRTYVRWRWLCDCYVVQHV